MLKTVYQALIVALAVCLASTSLQASTPLKDQRLTRGRSKAVQNPDYYFKLYDSIMLNSGYSTEDVREISYSRLFSFIGAPGFSSDDFYELDAELRRLIDPMFLKYFPDSLAEYNLIILNHPSVNAGIFISKNPKNRPTIVINKGLLKLLATEEEVQAVFLHEAGHHLRATLTNDSKFVKSSTAMAEEGLADSIAVRVMAESGKNPIGMSKLLEALLQSRAGVGGANSSLVLSGFSTHPPTKPRLTAVNVQIEHYAERMNFPELTKLGSMFDEYTSSPGLERDKNGEPIGEVVGFNLQGLGFGDGHYGESSLVRLYRDATFEELAVVHQRLAPGNIQEWLSPGNWDDVGSALSSRWASTWEKRADPELLVRAAEDFITQETLLKQKALECGHTLVTMDSKIIESLHSLLSISSKSDVLDWYRKYPDLYYAGYTYSLSRHPTLVVDSFSHYVNISQKLATWIDEAFEANNREHLNALSGYRGAMLQALGSWIAINHSMDRNLLVYKYYPEANHYNNYSRHDYRSKVYRNGYTRYEDDAKEKYRNDIAQLADSQATERLAPWDAQISASTIPNYIKFALFKGSRFQAVYNFVRYPTLHSLRYSDFNKSIRVIKALERDLPNNKFPLVSIAGEKAPQWLLNVVSQLDLSSNEVLSIIGDDLYWQRPDETTKEEVSEVVTGWIQWSHPEDRLMFWKESIFDYINFLIDNYEHKKERLKEREEAQSEANRYIDNYFRKDNFYNRPEYKLDLFIAQNMQNILYNKLKDKQAIPNNIEHEIQLWIKFTKRGVTAFTDEWADSLVNRLLARIEEDAASIDLLRSVYQSNLVWALPLRQRMATKLFSPEYHPLVGSLRADSENPTSSVARRTWGRITEFLGAETRLNKIDRILREVTREFPEDSLERAAVVDRIAQNIQATKEETAHMMGLIGAQPRDIKNVDLSLNLGFGVRLYAQLFEEISTFPVHEQTELIEFLLGHSDKTPWVMSVERIEKEKADYHRYAHFHRPILKLIAENKSNQFSPFRLRRSFQALSTEAKAALLDPLFAGNDGIMATSEGRQWVIDFLVPQDAEWRAMATDLTDGFVQALSAFGQSHLKTLFMSHLIVSNYKNGRTQFEGLFPRVAIEDDFHESADGRLLRSLFSANAPLNKVGQNLHSSQVLRRDINDSIASLKENASHTYRDTQYNWLESAETQPGASSRVLFQGSLGNASVKLVANALINGAESILYLIKPNAFRRGDSFFQMIEYAVNYAVEKGHDDLRLIQPLIGRARKTFQAETDLNLERESVERMRSVYAPGQSYGNGYQFISLEFLDITDKIFKSNLVAAAKRVRTKRFFELGKEEQVEFARAVAEKEIEIHSRTEGAIHYDRDRHEGNYLLIDDQEYLKSLSLEGQKVILVIDMGQATTIEATTRSGILDAVAAVTAHNLKMIPPGVPGLRTAAEHLETILNEHLLAAGVSHPVTAAVVSSHLPKLSQLQGGAALSRLLAYVEADGYIVRDDVFDYLAALNTFSSWERYQPGNAFISGLQRDVLNRCMLLLSPPR